MLSNEAYEQLYQNHYLRVYKHIRRYVKNEADAEDLCQNVFFSIWRNWRTFDPSKCPPGAWVFMVANNLLKNYYRDVSNKADTTSIDAGVQGGDSDEMQMQIEDPKDSMQQAQRLMEAREQVNQALECLNEREKTIVVNRYLCDMEIAAVAKELGMTEGNVRVTASRALKKMSAFMQEQKAAGG